MSEQPELVRLLNNIQQQVTALQHHLTATQQSDPSFDGNAPQPDWTGIDDTRASCIETLVHLSDLLSTPKELLQQVTATDLISRHFLDRFDVYKLVPVGETRTYDELAKAIGQPMPVVRRIFRHAMTQRIFHEPLPNVIAHTHVSRLFVESEPMRDYYGTICQEIWPAATRTADALEKCPGSDSKEQSGYFLHAGRTLQQTLDAEPAKHKRYDSAMQAYASDRTFGLQHVITGYDWAALGKATIVDVGGGVGTVSKALAEEFPDLDFIVQDQADVIANASIENPAIRDRVRFSEHNFFHEQPVKGAEIYFIRRVFMEWRDDKAIEILRNILPAMGRDSRVLIQDFYVPAPGELPLRQERRTRNSDMLLICLSNGARRELEDWEPLFDKSGGFEFKRIIPIKGSDVVFIEAIKRFD